MSTEIRDFAGALRQMADNADQLAERHDLRHVAQLHQMIDDQSAAARRNQDLVDELRRQVAGMGRSLDTIGRIRKSVLTGHAPADVVQILVDALVILAGVRCSSFTSGSCRSATSGKTRGAPYLADAWCTECVARDALERAGVGVEDGESGDE